MLKSLLASLGLVVALAGGAQAQEEPEMETDQRRSARDEELLESDQAPPIHRRWSAAIAAKASAGGGAVSGDTIIPGRGAMSVFAGQITGEIDRGSLELEAPIQVATRQTFAGASLSESRVDGGARASYRLGQPIRVAVEMGLTFVSRPGWPDPFQVVGGAMVPTDRYGYWARRGGVDLFVRSSRRDRLILRYDYELSVYRRDPIFDPIYDPTHLAPWDEDSHRLDGVWRHDGRGWNVQLGAEVGRRRYFFRFAGDAGSGTTHAGPSGHPNPLLQMRWEKPRLAFQVDRWTAVTFGAGYELELMQDVYRGYLSYVGQHPDLFASVALPWSANLTAHADLFWRRYGPDSYQGPDANPAHSPLTWGTRRADHLGTVLLAFRLPVLPHWTALANSALAVRRTNYSYGINWNYTTWSAWAGVEWAY